MATLRRLCLLLAVSCAYLFVAPSGGQLRAAELVPYGVGYYSSYYGAYYPVYYSPTVYSSYYYPVYTTSYYPVARYAYYVPAVSYSLPIYVPATACATAVPLTPSYATPSPAPPSGAPNPPAGKQPPTVKETTTPSSYGSFYSGPPSVSGNAGSKLCQVTFWNLADRTVTIRVNNDVHVVPAKRSLALTLPRQFVWRLDQQAAQNEDVPANRASLDVVLHQ